MKILDLYSFIRIKNTSTYRERSPTSLSFSNFNDQNFHLDSSTRDRRISNSVFDWILSVCLSVCPSVRYRRTGTRTILITLHQISILYLFLFLTLSASMSCQSHILPIYFIFSCMLSFLSLLLRNTSSWKFCRLFVAYWNLLVLTLTVWQIECTELISVQLILAGDSYKNNNIGGWRL